MDAKLESFVAIDTAVAVGCCMPLPLTMATRPAYRIKRACRRADDPPVPVSPRRSDQAIRNRLAAAVQDHLAALVLRRYVAAMADSGADIQDGLDFLALKALRLLGGAAG